MSTSYRMDSVPGTLMHALLLKDHEKAQLKHALTTVSTSWFPEATNAPVTERFQWLIPSNGTPYSNLILKLIFILSLLLLLLLLYRLLRFVSLGKGALQMPVTNAMYYYYINAYLLFATHHEKQIHFAFHHCAGVTKACKYNIYWKWNAFVVTA